MIRFPFLTIISLLCPLHCTCASAPNSFRKLKPFSILFPVALLLITGSISAQDLTTPLLSDSWQATFSNPALYGNMPGRLTIGAPGVVNDLAVENITYNDLLSLENDQRVLDLSLLSGLLEERNEIRDDFSVETIGVGLRGDKWSLGLAHRLRARGELDYPKTLLQLVAEGNAQFIGQTIEIAPLGFVTSFHEIGFGASYQLTDKIFLGGRVKYLSGIADIRTADAGSLRLTTGEENFALTLDQDLTVNSAGAIDYDGASDININYDLNRLRTDQLFSGNNGIAFDLGLFVDLGKLRLQAAANDIGGNITWENEVTNLEFTGTDAFTGLDVLEQFFEDSVSFDGAIDSLRIEFEPTESNGAYSSGLYNTYLLGGEFDVTDRLTAGLLVAHYDRPQTTETAVALSARYRVLDELTIGLNYNARRNAAANLGLHLIAKIGPIHLLAATDNLLTVFRQRDTTRSGFRLGSSLSFGGVRHKTVRKKKEGRR